MKYRKVEAGEWIWPVMEGYKFSCCDCGLVHTMDFQVDGNDVGFRVFRDNRATGQKRRKIFKRVKQCIAMNPS